jgi:hypothetical protein
LTGYWQQGAKPPPNSRIKAGLWILAAGPNGRNQGALGQTLEHHGVHPRGGQHHGRIDPVTGKACTCTDHTNGGRHHKPM